MEEHLTTRQVAEALSVSESSVKRWCNQGVIPTVRTVGGHRRIPLSGFMHFLNQTNRQIVVPLGSSTRHGHSVSERSLEDLKRRFTDALVAGDERACREAVVEFYARTESFALLADEFIAETFHQLGDQWDCGDIEVYQERRGCEVCSRVLHEFRRLLPEVPDNAPLAMGGTPEGDYYSIPTQLAELVVRECSWRAMNLGSNLPLSTIAAAVAEHQPRMLWLSVSHLKDPVDFVEQYRAFRATIPQDLTVVLGGRALTDRLRPKLKYTGHCDNMQQLASFATAMHGRRHSIDVSNN